MDPFWTHARRYQQHPLSLPPLRPLPSLAGSQAEENVELHIATHAFMEGVGSWRDKVREGIKKRCGLPNLEWEKMPKVFVTQRFIRDKVYPKVGPFSLGGHETVV